MIYGKKKPCKTGLLSNKRKLLSTFSSTLHARTRIISQRFYSSHSFDSTYSFFSCFSFYITWFFIKSSTPYFTKNSCSLPHLFKSTQGSLKRLFFFYLYFNHGNHLQSVVVLIKIIFTTKSRRF